MCCLFFFFKQKTAYEMRISDWSSDVCSSDLQSASSTNLTTRSSAAARVPAMKIDGGLGGDLRNAGKAAASQEAQGYDGVWTAETSHDPFFPLLLASQISEEHTSELQSLMRISYAVFCLKKKKQHTVNTPQTKQTTGTQSTKNTK